VILVDWQIDLLLTNPGCLVMWRREVDCNPARKLRPTIGGYIGDPDRRSVCGYRTNVHFEDETFVADA